MYEPTSGSISLTVIGSQARPYTQQLRGATAVHAVAKLGRPAQRVKFKDTVRMKDEIEESNRHFREAWKLYARVSPQGEAFDRDGWSVANACQPSCVRQVQQN